MVNKERTKVLVVEDRIEERRAVINHLQRYGVCNADTLLPPAGTYTEACRIIEIYGPEIKLVSLDLNIPLDDQDGSPDNSNGGKLLEHIHDMNGKPDHQMRVIVVSGQEIAKGWNASNLMTRFCDTLVGVARKDAMPRSFIEQLQKLGRDPLRNALVDLNFGVVDDYDVVVDSQQRIKERLKCARSLAIRLLQNEKDHFHDSIGVSEANADDLGRLIQDVVDRFSEQTLRRRDGSEFQKRIVSASEMEHGSWHSFVWRGSLLQHLYCLNNYRNDYEHIADKPFRCGGGRPDDWQIPPDTLRSLERGERLGQIVELIVGDLLHWYLPWHEQVYLPWRRTTPAGGGAP